MRPKRRNNREKGAAHAAPDPAEEFEMIGRDDGDPMEEITLALALSVLFGAVVLLLVLWFGIEAGPS